MKTRLRLGLLGAAVLLTSAAVPLTSTCAADGAAASRCVPKFSDEPAAGIWKGTATFNYKMEIEEGTAYDIDWSGAIDLNLTRSERPRRSPCPGIDAAVLARLPLPPAGCNRDGTPIPQLARDERPPALKGLVAFGMKMLMVISEPGLEFKHEAASQKLAGLSAEAERDSTGLKGIALKGTPDQFQFASNLMSRDAAGLITGEAELNGSGKSSIQLTIQGESTGFGRAEGDGHEIKSHVDVVDSDGQRHVGDSTAAIAGLDQARRMLFELVVDKRECGVMSGTTQSAELVEQIRSAGMRFIPVKTEWQATLAERDESLEQSAKRYAAAAMLRMDPGNAEATWASWQSEWNLYSALRGANPSDYRLCVLKPAHEKIVGATEAALRALLDSSARDSDVVKQRMWQLIATIEAFNRTAYVDCPVVREAIAFLLGTLQRGPDSDCPASATSTGTFELSGDQQTARVGTQVPDPLVVSVIDACGRPAAGRWVMFMVTENDGTVTCCDFGFGYLGVGSTTDANGKISGEWKLGESPGRNTITVSVLSPDFSHIDNATFTATGVPARAPP